MRNMERDFLGHVAINQRIYEFTLVNFGLEDETLKINDIPFPEFSLLKTDELLNKRSIAIENHLVHFYLINGQMSVEVEDPDMNKSTVEEKLAAPYFNVISDIVENDAYYTDETTQKEVRKSYLALFIYGLIMMFAFVMNPPLGLYSGMFLCVILDFLHETYQKYQIAKQFPRSKDRWL